MIESKELERAGTEAVKRLRLNKFRSGKPFMINSKELPGDQCYMEYPDGRIELVTISSADRDFIVMRELTKEESFALRNKYNLKYY